MGVGLPMDEWTMWTILRGSGGSKVEAYFRLDIIAYESVKLGGLAKYWRLTRI